MATPYQEAAQDYFDAGWSPIPLPQNSKDPVPDGYTGVKGEYVSRAQLKLWLRPTGRVNAGKLNFPPGNIALRLPNTVLGVDVDAYGSKAGAATLAAAEKAWGPLPATWLTTSRDDGISGIRLFTIPEGLAWPGQLPQGGGVELLRWDHRYALVEPSTNPQNKGKPYVWYRDGVRTFAIPELSDLPALSEAWVTGLTSGKKWKERGLNEDMDVDSLQLWLSDRNDPNNLCQTMRTTLTNYSRKLREAGDDGGAHDVARNGAWALLGDAGSGHTGIVAALAKLRKIFLNAIEGRRADVGAGRNEWARAVLRGAQKVTAEIGPDSVEDPCALTVPLKPRKAKKGSEAYDYTRDDIGNAQRLLNGHGIDMAYCGALGGWFAWDGEVWGSDAESQVMRWAMETARAMTEEAAFIEDPDDLKAFKSFARASSNAGKLNAMMDLARTMTGVEVSANKFDADPAQLVCGNGTLVLGEEVTFRANLPSDYNTHRTETKFVAGATHKLWTNYLNKFLPDEEIRDWVQTIVGYSLLGDNPEQLLIVCQGETGSGKTTFAEAIMAALGRYAGPLEASVLRGSSDDKPRPDIIKAIARRIVVAEELSEFQHLHVDQAKRITGAGTLSARGMNSNSFVERRAAFTAFLMTNETPTIEGGDAALRNRLLVIPFDVQEPRTQKGAKIRDRIVTEAREAVLAWAVAGWERYSAGVDLRAIPAGALAANLKFADEMSDFHTFVSECCDVGPDYQESPAALFHVYETWCETNRIDKRNWLSVVKFGRRMNAIGTKRVKVRNGEELLWVRVGIRLLPKYKKLVS